jgi:predicted GIY-YIG superfamily endonuclease
MSEYQYYEFQAIDRPLTAKEMSELRSYSTRARITPTSFVNEYSFGSFKGNEDAWMEKYFDAYLYLANWGTHVLKLRLPSRLLDAATAKTYCGGDSAFVREKAGKVVLSFVSQDEEGGDWVEGEGHLSSMISVRAELARGDLRALYLGWLLRAQTGELDDNDTEPPVPPGLGQLSASLESLAEFLRIDGDLLHVAAEVSPPIGDTGLDRDDVRAWVGKLAAKEKDELITNLVVDADHAQIAELLQRFLKEQAGNDTAATTGRTVGQLLHAAEAYTTERQRIEAEKRAKEKARREREAAIAREKHLDSLVGREGKLWTEVDGLVATKQPKNYDQAVRILVDLRDLAARGKNGDFGLRIAALRQAQAKKPSFIERLRKAGL